MAKVPTNQGKAWSAKDIKALKKFAEGNTPTGIIAMKMGRSEGAIQSKASSEQISLKPTNQSPYDRAVSKKKKGNK